MDKRTPTTLRRRILGAIGLIVVAFAWFLFAPQNIGGRVAYTVVTGRSMEPTLEAGDLVIVRRASGYDAGDAIAYRSEALDQVVLHRIVDVIDGRFVTRGDNNDFLDSDRPGASDVLGALWVRIPQGGVVIEGLRSPVGSAAVAVGGLGLLGAFSVERRRRRRSGRHRAGPAAAPSGAAIDSASERARAALPVRVDDARRHRTRLQIGMALLAAATLGFSSVAAIAFVRPAFQTQPRRIKYAHAGQFDYSAPAPRGPVYQSRVIGAGDPVFVRLVGAITVGFAYELLGDVPRDVQIDGRLMAVLSNGEGWSHELELTRAASSDATLDLTGELDIAAVRRLLRRIERMTGMAPGSYSVAVEPRIEVRGDVAGREIDDVFAPSLPLRLNDIQLGVVREQTPAGQQPLAALLNPRDERKVDAAAAVAAPLDLAGREFSLLALRRVGVGGAALSLLALAALALVWVLRGPRDEATRIAARYGSLLIPVGEPPDLRLETVDVQDFDTLVKLAQQFEQPILHCALAGGTHSYVLCYDGLAYRYAADGPSTASHVEAVEGPDDSVAPIPVHAVLTRRFAPVPDDPERTIGLGS